MADRNIEVFRRVSLGGTTLPDNTQAGPVVPFANTNSVSQNRIVNIQTTHPGDDTTNAATWTSGEDIHTVKIPPNCKYVINSLSGVTAKTALEGAADISLTTQIRQTFSEPEVYTQRSVITRLDIVKTDATAETAAVIEAGS